MNQNARAIFWSQTSPGRPYIAEKNINGQLNISLEREKKRHFKVRHEPKDLQDITVLGLLMRSCFDSCKVAKYPLKNN